MELKRHHIEGVKQLLTMPEDALLALIAKKGFSVESIRKKMEDPGARKLDAYWSAVLEVAKVEVRS